MTQAKDQNSSVRDPSTGRQDVELLSESLHVCLTNGNHIKSAFYIQGLRLVRMFSIVLELGVHEFTVPALFLCV